MKVLVLFLFTEIQPCHIKDEVNFPFFSLKKKDNNNTKENSIPSEIGKNAMDKERERGNGIV